MIDKGERRPETRTRAHNQSLFSDSNARTFAGCPAGVQLSSGLSCVRLGGLLCERPAFPGARGWEISRNDGFAFPHLGAAPTKISQRFSRGPATQFVNGDNFCQRHSRRHIKADLPKTAMIGRNRDWPKWAELGPKVAPDRTISPELGPNPSQIDQINPTLAEVAPK